MRGLGWTGVTGNVTSCDEIQPDGHRICFRTTTVDGHPPEERFARNQGCIPLQSAASCRTSPYNNPGKQYCCPKDWPRAPGSPAPQPGEFPPAPPGLMNKIEFYRQYWWFWALLAGVPVVGFLGYQYLKDEGYVGGPPAFAGFEGGGAWE